MPTVIYKTNDNVYERIFKYESSCQIEDMLIQFLKETHSIITLNTDDIVFLFGPRILNKMPTLKKTVGEIFKDGNCRNIIKVIDNNAIIGSNGYL